MSQNRRIDTKATYENYKGTRNGRNRSTYVYGAALPKSNALPVEEPERRVRKQAGPQPVGPGRRPDRRTKEIQDPEIVRRRNKARRMSFGYALFLTVALCASAYILVNFIQLQSTLITTTKTVAAKERELNTIRLKNDEEYNRIINSIDLEEIKRTAIGELGMVYAKEGQIVYFANESKDYMRQTSDSRSSNGR